MHPSTEVTFNVSEVCQTASGGSYFVKYQARVPEEPHLKAVYIKSTVPADADNELLQSGQQAMARGTAKALSAMGQGFDLTVTDFVVHPIDFKPSKVEQFTQQAVTEALQAH